MTELTQFKPVIIGIRGFFQSGKDTIAAIFEETFNKDNYDVDVRSFAHNLRIAIMKIFGFNYTYVFSEEFKTDLHDINPIGQPDKKMTGRELLQYFGTEVCRAMSRDCWSHSCINEIRCDDIGVAIVKDVRFLTEVQAIRNSGNPSFIIRVERPGHNGDGHQSERELADASGIDDFVIQNDGSIEDLKKKVQQVYKEIRKRINATNESVS